VSNESFEPSPCACSSEISLVGYTGGKAPEGLYGKLHVHFEGQPKWVDYIPETELVALRTQLADVTIERDTARKDNDVLRGLLGNSAKDCPYCGLPAAEQAKCGRGFPGCARADDQQLSQHFADGYFAKEYERERDTALANIAMLREALEGLTKYGYMKPSLEAMTKAINALDTTK